MTRTNIAAALVAAVLLSGCSWPDAMGGGCMWPCNTGVPGRGEGLPTMSTYMGGGLTVYDNGWAVQRSGINTFYSW